MALTTKEAEELSKKQQTAIASNLPTSGQLFLTGGTKNNENLSFLKDNTVFRLGFQLPELSEQQRTDITANSTFKNSPANLAQELETARFGGQTMSQLKGAANTSLISELGLSGLQSPNLADLTGTGVNFQDITDPEEFKKLIAGAGIFGGPQAEVPSGPGGTPGVIPDGTGTVTQQGQFLSSAEESFLPPDRQALTQKVLATDPNLEANADFIQAVAQAKFGRAATADELKQVGDGQFGLLGAKTGDVLARFGIGQEAPVVSQEAKTATLNDKLPFTLDEGDVRKQSIVDLIQSGKEFNAQDAENLAFAFGKEASDFIGKTGENLFEAISTEVKVDDEITTNDLTSDPEVPETFAGLESLITEIKKGQASILEAMKPTIKETDLKTKLADVREQAGQLEQSFEEGLVDVEGQAIPLAFISGQARELEKRANLKMNNLQRKEANLLSRLGLEQDLRESDLEALKLGQGFLESNTNLLFKVDKLQQEEEDRILSKAESLSDDAKDTLGTMLDLLQGVGSDDLTPEMKSQLLKASEGAGIPFDILLGGLDNIKNQLLIKNTKSGGLTFSQQQSLAKAEKDELDKGEDVGFYVDQIREQNPGFVNEEDPDVPNFSSVPANIRAEVQRELSKILDFEDEPGTFSGEGLGATFEGVGDSIKSGFNKFLNLF